MGEGRVKQEHILIHSSMSLKSSLPHLTFSTEMVTSPQNYPFQLDSVALQYYPPASSLFTLLWFCRAEQSLGAELASTPSTTTLLSKSPYSLLLEGETDTSSRNTSLTPYSIAPLLSWHLSHRSGIFVLPDCLSHQTMNSLRTETMSSSLLSPESNLQLLAQILQNSPF